MSIASRLLLAMAVGIAGIAGADTATAQEWPSKLIRVIVPLAAGGPTDAKARLVAPRLTERLGQTVIVENRPGAAGAVGAEYVTRQPADGYHILVGTPSLTINESIAKNLPYDRKRDFIPVSLVGSGPLMFVVPPTLPVKTVADFIAHAKANPGKISYGSVGHGSISHLTSEYFRSLAGIEMTNIPYQGTGPAMLAVINGEVQFLVDAITTAGPQISAGKAKALAVTTAARSPLLPEVPTLVESGFAGFDIPFWAGFFVRTGTPEAIVDRLSREVMAILATQEVKQQLANLGTVPGEFTPTQFAAYLDNQAAIYAAAAKAANIKPTE